MKKFLLLLFLFFVAYYIIKAFSKLIKLFVQKREKQQEFSGNFQQNSTIFSENKKKRFEKDDGEYVDYEEVK